eukprot:scaffold5567_cov108-Isochrysis_galbana.AAC.4
MSGVGSLPQTASGAVVASGLVRGARLGRPDDTAVECDGGAWHGPRSGECWCMSGTRSAPLLGVAYGLGPETATDSIGHVAVLCPCPSPPG